MVDIRKKVLVPKGKLSGGKTAKDILPDPEPVSRATAPESQNGFPAVDYYILRFRHTRESHECSNIPAQSIVLLPTWAEPRTWQSLWYFSFNFSVPIHIISRRSTVRGMRLTEPKALYTINAYDFLMHPNGDRVVVPADSSSMCAQFVKGLKPLWDESAILHSAEPATQMAFQMGDNSQANFGTFGDVLVDGIERQISRSHDKGYLWRLADVVSNDLDVKDRPLSFVSSKTLVEDAEAVTVAVDNTGQVGRRLPGDGFEDETGKTYLRPGYAPAEGEAESEEEEDLPHPKKDRTEGTDRLLRGCVASLLRETNSLEKPSTRRDLEDDEGRPLPRGTPPLPDADEDVAPSIEGFKEDVAHFMEGVDRSLAFLGGGSAVANGSDIQRVIRE